MFLHTYHPQPILLDLGFAQIYWYGFLIALGAILGFFVFYKLAQKIDIKKEEIFNLTFWLIIWGIIGGRLYHVLSEISYYFHYPWEIFFIWQGGLGIFGTLLAGILVVFFSSLSRAERSGAEGSRGLKPHYGNATLHASLLKSLLILDLLAPAIALAQAIGRWGNYFNQELYGWPANLPWAIPIDLVNRVAGFENFTHFHPTFLYESLFCFLVFLLTIVLARRIGGESLPAGRQGSYRKSGAIFLLYLFLYSTWRFLIEFMRLDPQPILCHLKLGQWTSLLLIILSIFLYFIFKKWHNKIATYTN